jgi:hypothetical protein
MSSIYLFNLIWNPKIKILTKCIESRKKLEPKFMSTQSWSLLSLDPTVNF